LGFSTAFTSWHDVPRGTESAIRSKQDWGNNV
jgi:hypothetical protein